MASTPLYAALDMAAVAMIDRRYPKYRSSKFRKLIDLLVTAMPTTADAYLVMDNYATHKPG